MSTIADNIAQVSSRIHAAAQAAQRDEHSVQLLAVSKTKPAEALREAYAAGLRDFGENYLQEALGKQLELTDLPLIWHFIGPIQSNKTRAIAEHFDWVHSVDRLKIAQRLSEQRPADLPPLNICIQVNVSGEASKSGCTPTDLPLIWHFIGPIQSNKTRAIAEHFAWVHSVDRLKIAQRLSEQRPADMPALNICIQVNVSGEASKSGCAPADLPALAKAISELPHLRLRGLMAIPEPTEDRAAQDAAFAAVQSLQASLNLPLDTLSMGMSHDLEAAIAHGATWVRIGTALFGARDYGQP